MKVYSGYLDVLRFRRWHVFAKNTPKSSTPVPAGIHTWVSKHTGTWWRNVGRGWWRCLAAASEYPLFPLPSPLSSLKVQAWSLKPSLGGSDLLLHQSAQWYSTDVDLTLVKHRPRRKLPIWCRKLLMVLVMGVDIHGDWRYHQSSTREMLQSVHSATGMLLTGHLRVPFGRSGQVPRLLFGRPP